KAQEEKKRKEDEAAAEAQREQAEALLAELSESEREALLVRFEKEVVEDHFIGKIYKKEGLESILVRGFWEGFVIGNC
ncbi:MAG: hypothetical protein ACON4K_12910, partial [Akkermansiaceae bacterium]